MTDDIVAELDAWLDVTSGEPDEQWLAERPMVQRARDVIVALEEMRQAHIRMLAANQDDAREAALEEAARVCERMARHAEGVGQLGFTEAFEEVCATLSAAIRALKEKH